MSTRTAITDYYADNYDNLVRMVNRRTKNLSDAEDVVQEAFYNALKFEKSYNPSLASLKTWFNHLLNRTYSRMRSAEFDSEELKDTDIMDWGFDDRIANNEDVDAVKKYISSVTNPDHRNILYLSLLLGNSDKEVSTSLGFNMSTVRVTLCRHKEIIREMLS